MEKVMENPMEESMENPMEESMEEVMKESKEESVEERQTHRSLIPSLPLAHFRLICRRLDPDSTSSSSHRNWILSQRLDPVTETGSCGISEEGK